MSGGHMAPRNVTPETESGWLRRRAPGGEGDLPGWCEHETWEGSAGLAPWVPACPWDSAGGRGCH